MKKQNLISYISIFLFLTLLHSNSRAPNTSENAFALVNGKLTDGTGVPPLLDAVLIIEDEHIRNVGHLEKIAIPEGTKVIDVEGHTIIPGFINAHVHRGYDEHNLKTWAKNGVTTVRDLGGNPRNNLFAFRDRVNKNPKFARLVAAGPMVTVPDGYPKVPWGAPSALPITSPDDAQKR